MGVIVRGELSRGLQGNWPPRKIAPDPNSNTNPKPNPNPYRGTVFLGGGCPDTFCLYKNIFLWLLFFKAIF